MNAFQSKHNLWGSAIALVQLLCVGGFGYRFLDRVMRYLEQVKKITFEQIGLSSLKDGPYQGEYDADVLYARV